MEGVDDTGLVASASLGTTECDVCLPIPSNNDGKAKSCDGKATISSGKHRKREKSVQRYNRPPFSYFYVIGMGIFLLLLIIGCVTVESWRSGSRMNNVDEVVKPHTQEEKEYHHNIVTEVNAKGNSSWTARYNAFAARAATNSYHIDPLEAARIVVRRIQENNYSGLVGDTKEHLLDLTKKKINLPRAFDIRLRWPACWSVHYIDNQGGCGSCWSVAATSVMSDRVCIATNYSQQPHISAQDLTSCCQSCGGCQGTHWALSSFTFWKEHGIVTGGSYGSSEGCRPYTHSAQCGSPCSPSMYKRSRTPICDATCQPLYGKPYDDDLVHSRSAYWLRAEHGTFDATPIVKNTIRGVITESGIPDAEILKRELFLYGPVLACFTVHENFQHYQKGIYDPNNPTSEELYGHCVKLIGWGEENGRKYWIYANTWGRDWGENGFFRVAAHILPEEVVAGTF